MPNNPIVNCFGTLLLTGIICCNANSATTAEQTLAKVHDAARAALLQQAEKLGLQDPIFTIETVRTARPLPPCPSETKVESLDTRALPRMRFVAICGAAPGWRYELVVRANVTAKVAVAANDLMAGKFLSPSDLLLERHDVTALPDSFSDLTVVEGMAARRTIRAGDVLRQNMLAAPVLVKRGQPVRIVARREQIEVSMAGEALDTGGRGELVRVRNSSGTTIRARVTEAGVVEPADLPASN